MLLCVCQIALIVILIILIINISPTSLNVNSKKYDAAAAKESFDIQELEKPLPCECFDVKPLVPPDNLGIDEKNVMIAGYRKLNKMAIDGRSKKTADFYRDNFDGELDAEENRPWWSRDEY